jgi:hypothetical protein
MTKPPQTLYLLIPASPGAPLAETLTKPSLLDGYLPKAVQLRPYTEARDPESPAQTCFVVFADNHWAAYPDCLSIPDGVGSVYEYAVTWERRGPWEDRASEVARLDQSPS